MREFHTKGRKKQLMMDFQKNTEMLLKCTQKNACELTQRRIHTNIYMELYALAGSIGALMELLLGFLYCQR